MGTQRILSQRQKAAVIVRLLLDTDNSVDLSVLKDDRQGVLAEEMAGLEMIDRVTRDAVIEEFCDTLNSVGITFPGGLNPTLDYLGNRISETTSDRLRRMAALSGAADPWARIAAMPAEKLTELAQNEAVELVALMLSKLPVAKASDVFSALGAERARAVAHAISMTGNVNHDALARVGLVLLRAAEALPTPAIEATVVDRVGAILNFTSADIRESVLAGLDEDDAVFAEDVRKILFTFAHIATRVEARDIPRVIREADNTALIRALAGAEGEMAASAQFILDSISSRMAEGLREDMAAVGKLRPHEIDEGMKEVVAAIRRLESTGELTLVLPEPEE